MLPKPKFLRWYLLKLEYLSYLLLGLLIFLSKSNKLSILLESKAI
nr:MAG TPA: hypothetical protein [Bacteriophage sp.]